MNVRVDIKKSVYITLLLILIHQYIYSVLFSLLSISFIISSPSPPLKFIVQFDNIKKPFWNVYIFKIGIKRVEKSFYFIYFSNNGMTILLHSIVKYPNNEMKSLFHFALFHSILLYFVPLYSIIFYQFNLNIA